MSLFLFNAEETISQVNDKKTICHTEKR